MKDLVSIIIVNWNGKKFLKKCFSSLEKINYPNYEIILVDNGSTDGSVEYIKKNFPQVKIIQNKENLGFAEANNIGYQQAKGKYILLLNNDTEVTPDFLNRLVTVLKSDEKIGVVQPKILLSSQPSKIETVGSYLTSTGFLYHFGWEKDAKKPKYNLRQEIFSARGACMLIKKEVVEKVGLFDKDFFAYFEETDFCWRTWLAGYKIIYVPNSVICHKGGGTASRISLPFIDYHSFKNRICTLIKNLELKNLLKILPLHLLLCLGISFFFFLKGELKHGFAILRGIGWNIKNLRKNWQKRRIVQRQIRKIPDKELLPKIKRKVRPPYYYYLLAGLEKYED